MRELFDAVISFFSSRLNRALLLIGILIIAAIIDFFYLGLARRTFVFYTLDNNEEIVVEDRMIKHTGSRENDIIRYTEEVLLGPVAPGLLPLFPRGTRLKSLLLRNGVVYIDLTQDAEMPPAEGGETKVNFITLYEGILRNFPYVKDVRFFIEGRAAYSDGLTRES